MRKIDSLVAGVALAAVLVPQAHAASPDPVVADNGMVVSAHHFASHAGVEVLRHGGNAVDAAVDVAYELAVTFPAAGNIGGGGFMTVRLADGRETFIDFRFQVHIVGNVMNRYFLCAIHR